VSTERRTMLGTGIWGSREQKRCGAQHSLEETDRVGEAQWGPFLLRLERDWVSPAWTASHLGVLLYT
jgi:hypothetical protein